MFSRDALGPLAETPGRRDTRPNGPAVERLEAGERLPPDEVLHALGEAAHILDELAARQVDVHFELDTAQNALLVKMHDPNRTAVRRLPLEQLPGLAGRTPGARAA